MQPTRARGARALLILGLALAGACSRDARPTEAVPPEIERLELALLDPEGAGATPELWRPGLVRIGDEARRAVLLTAPHPLVARARVEEGAWLSFSTAPAPLAGGALGAVAVVVRIVPDGAGDEPVASRHAVEDGWREVRIDLAPFAGRDVAIELAVEAGPGAAGACTLGEPVLATPGDAAPTVLLVTSSAHRADHVAVSQGPLPIATGTLDALAEHGVRFERAVAPANGTRSAHAALFHGSRDAVLAGPSGAELPADAATLAECFQDAGWATLAVVALPELGDSRSGLGRGFDRMSWPLDGPRSADLAIDVLERWLPDVRGRPLFVWLALADARPPWRPPDAYAELYYPLERDPRDPSRATAAFPAPLGWDGIVDPVFPTAQYRAAITFLDAQLDRVVARPRFQDGIVAFTADHGLSLGEQDVFWEAAGLNPGVLRVPLIVAWPGAPRGRTVSELASPTDLGRTLVELAGLDAGTFPGRSLAGAPPAADAPGLGALAADGSAASWTADDGHLVLALRDHRPGDAANERPRHSLRAQGLEDAPAPERETVRRLRAELAAWLAGAGAAAGGGVDALLDPDCGCERCSALAR